MVSRGGEPIEYFLIIDRSICFFYAIIVLCCVYNKIHTFSYLSFFSVKKNLKFYKTHQIALVCTWHLLWKRLKTPGFCNHSRSFYLDAIRYPRTGDRTKWNFSQVDVHKKNFKRYFKLKLKNGAWGNIRFIFMNVMLTIQLMYTESIHGIEWQPYTGCEMNALN